LQPDTNYNLYLYSSMAAVPDGNFNANSAKAAQKWTVRIPSGSTYTITQNIMSNETAVYRAVPATAP
jgi:5,10-methylenetetrahydrofolate reductase